MNSSNEPIFETENEQIALPPENPVSRAKRRFSQTLLALLFIVLASSALSSFGYLILQARAPQLLESDLILLLLSSLSSYLVAMPLSLLFFRKIPATKPEKRRIALPSFLGFFCIAILLTFLGNIAGILVNSFLEAFLGSAPVNALEEISDDLPLWAEILFLVILAPIFEEIFYRKLIYDRIRVFGELPAILLCGILFGLIHGNFYQFFYAAAVGILFCYVYAKTGNLLYTIGLHALFNFSGTVLTEWLDRLLADEASPLFTAGMVALCGLGLLWVLSLVLAVLYWIRERKKILFDDAEEQLNGDRWAEAFFTSPVTWIFLLVSLLPFFSDFFTVFIQSL